MKKLCFILWLGLSFSWLGFGGKSDSKTGSTEEPWTLNMPEVIEDEKGNPIGLVLHLPEGLVDACEDDYWKLEDAEEAKKIETASDDELNVLCAKLLESSDLGKMKASQRFEVLQRLALILSLANRDNIMLSFEFCKRCDQESCLRRLLDREKKYLCTEEEEYLQQFHWCFPME